MMVKIQKKFLIVICLFLTYSRFPSFAQDNVSPTFTLLAQLPYEIAFHDLHTNRLWSWRIPNLEHHYDYRVDSWTLDSCGVVIDVPSNEGSQTILLTIKNFEYTELPFGAPIWSPDGTSIFYKRFERSSDSTKVYLANSLLEEPELFYSLDMWLGDVEWLSDYEWIFSDGYKYYVWDLQTKEVHLFEPNPLEVWESSKALRFYNYVNDELISPDWTMIAGFYDMASYRGAFSSDFELSEAQIAEIEAQEPSIPGFDILFLEANVPQHINVNGQFIQSLVWSPNSQQIAITTDYDGDEYSIYVYDVEMETLNRISDAYNDGWFWMYLPSWSPDSKWLAYRSPTGYEIQHLSTGQRIQLNETMNQSQSLLWSSLKDHEGPTCDNH